MVLSNSTIVVLSDATAWVVAVMLPPMAIFFPLFTLLEDFGYPFDADKGIDPMVGYITNSSPPIIVNGAIVIGTTAWSAVAEFREVAVAHAGWRGLQAGVLEATVAAMHAPAVQVQAWLGPAAGPSAYEIGAEVRNAFIAADGAAAEAAFRATRPGHWLCDLYALARMRLAAAGVSDVAGGERCTISEPGAFFSHRRDGRGGRMATLAWIDPGGR